MSDTTTAPKIPEVTDEAGESSAWLPVIGLAIAALLALAFVIIQAQSNSDEPQNSENTVETG